MFANRTAWNLAPNRFSVALERARKAGGELLDLTESNPTRVGLRYPAGTVERLADPRGMEYRPEALGSASAREAVARYYREMGAEVSPDAIVLTSSTSEAYAFVFHLLCDAGDEVLVGAPSYPLFDFLASLQDVKLAPYPLLYDHGWQIDFHSLEQRLGTRTRALMLVHPNNPTGSYVKPEERERLNQLCAPREMALVADEVFLDYALGGAAPFTFAANAGTLTFTLSGLSKVVALPQMKLSWIVVSGPKAARDAALQRLEVIADTYLSVGTAVQLALPGLLAERRELQKQIGERIRGNLAELDRLLAKQKTCARLELEAGWYAVVRVPATRSDEDLAILVLERDGVVVHPGHFYDFPSAGYLVLSLLPRPERFAEGVRGVLTNF